MPKPELEFHDPVHAPWQAAGPIAGFLEKILAKDDTTGDYTRLARMEPGTDTSPMGVQTHDFWEEVYIVEGSMTDLTLNETFHRGYYACRPPGMHHGPWRSDEGILMVEFRHGFALKADG